MKKKTKRVSLKTILQAKLDQLAPGKYRVARVDEKPECDHEHVALFPTVTGTKVREVPGSSQIVVVFKANARCLNEDCEYEFQISNLDMTFNQSHGKSDS